MPDAPELRKMNAETGITLHSKASLAGIKQWQNLCADKLQVLLMQGLIVRGVVVVPACVKGRWCHA